MSRSIQLIYPDELEILTASIPPHETPLWAYWEEFKTRYLRQGKSLNTVINVRDSLRWLMFKLNVRTIEECMEFRELEDKFYEYKAAREIRNTTLNSYRKNLNTYFILLERYEFIEGNPIKKIPKAKELNQAKLVLQEHQIAMITHQISTRRSASFERARNRFIIDLLRYTGARPCEIAALKWTDIKKSKDTYILTINGAKQNNRPRIYRLRSYVRDSLKNYINQIPPDRKNENHLLLSRKHGKSFGLKGFRYLFRQLSQELGINITAYAFRRHVATKLKKEGLSMEKIADYLGHTRTSTTRKYLEDLPDWTEEAAAILGRKPLDVMVKNHIV